jgi:protocatechuate 3,4-dioxygenase beta subunit
MNDMTRPGAIDPPYAYEDYKSTVLRAPKQPLVELPSGALDVPGPFVPRGFVKQGDNDLTAHGKSAPLGEKMVVTGRLLDESGRPIRQSRVEIWQANASGR